MIRRINTTAEAETLSSLSDDWRIVARRSASDWVYCGSFDANEIHMFRRMAFPEVRGEAPRVSCVTGRDYAGREVLYARLFPTLSKKGVDSHPPRRGRFW